jgi:hypothetical protein
MALSLLLGRFYDAGRVAMKRTYAMVPAVKVLRRYDGRDFPSLAKAENIPSAPAHGSCTAPASNERYYSTHDR